MSLPAMPTVHSLFDLSGRIALVTGAAGHLGGSIARALAEAGATVVASSRDERRAIAAAAHLPAVAGAPAHGTVAIDHLEETSINSGIDRVLEQFGKIDVLVNNAHEPLGVD